MNEDEPEGLLHSSSKPCPIANIYFSEYLFTGMIKPKWLDDVKRNNDN